MEIKREYFRLTIGSWEIDVDELRTHFPYELYKSNFEKHDLWFTLEEAQRLRDVLCLSEYEESDSNLDRRHAALINKAIEEHSLVISSHGPETPK
jgi:hypothetical protein